MYEEVGKCKKCGKKIFCLDGFLNGVVFPNGEIECFPCSEEKAMM